MSDHRHRSTLTFGCPTRGVLAFGGLLIATLAVCSPVATADQPIIASQPAEGPPVESIDLLTMEIPTVVTASRREQKITTVPYAMTVITAEDIRRSGARSVPDALRLAPGMNVADLASGAYGVSPRGIHSLLSNVSLVLVDGRQIFDSMFGGTLWGSWPFQLEDIDRIEVIRSPGGVAWGANTLNGVINIITKDPADQRGLTIIGGGGSRGAYKEYLGYGFADDKLRLRVSEEYESNDGFAKGGSWLRSLEDDYENGRIGAHAVYDAGPKDRFTLSGGAGLLDGGYPPPPAAVLGPRHNSGSRAEYLLLKWDRTIAVDNRLNVTSYVNDFGACPGTPGIDYRYQQFALQVGHTFKPADNHTVTWGIDSRTDLVDTSGSDPFMLTDDHLGTAIFGLYIQDEWRFAPRWVLNTGARIDYEFYTGFQPSARVALLHELADKSTVYGALSRTFQVPSVGLRFLDIPLLNGLLWATSDSDPSAATVLAYELGWRRNFFDRLDVNMNLFWNGYHDLGAFTSSIGPPGLVHLHFDDVASSTIYGAELDAKYALTQDLTLLGHYTYQQFEWDAPAHPTMKDMLTPPRHKFMIGARYNPIEDLHLSAHLYYVDAIRSPNPTNPFMPRHIDAYYRLDLRAEYEFWKDRASIAVGVRNLLQANHQEGSDLFINEAEVPRMVYAEMRMTFR
ncbi:MAG: TonB-dependent receptor [Planctomycetes bacterium]|nr:TonB-dependent receptor [Planctomycetota bacterium]